MQGNITPNFTWAEVLKSETHASLIAQGKMTLAQTLPNEEQQKNIIYLFEKVIQPIRIAYGKPLKLNNVFRSPTSNVIIGGAKNSDHMCNGGRAAVDIEPTDASLGEDFALWVFKNQKNYPIRQFIIEFPDANGTPSWCHIASDRLDNEADHNLLIAVKENGATVYKPATTEILKKYKVG